MRKAIFLTIFLGGAVSGVWADELIFKSGAHLTGTFIKLEKEKLVFNSDEVGEVTVDKSKVESFTSEAPAKFVFKDGTVITSKILGLEGGQIMLEKTQLLAGGKYALSEVLAINPPPVVVPRWKGSLTAGFTSTHGNTYAESGSISFGATRRREKDRMNIFARYLASRTKDSVSGDKKTTEESFTLGGKYDYFFSPKWYGFLDGNFKKDHISDLDRRIIAGVGLGYQWIESEKMNFSSDFGVSELCEQYTRYDQTTQSDELSARLGYHFDRVLYQGVDFIHNLNYYPSVTGRISNYFLSTDAEVRMALTESMFGSFKAILDYDSTPAPGIGKTDTKYILGVGWTF